MLRFATRLFSALALFAVLAAVPSAAPAADTKPIDGLLPIIEKLGWQYERIDDSTALVQVPLEDGTKVPVYLGVETDKNGNQVFGCMVNLIGYPGAAPANVESKINELNPGLKYGKLQIVKRQDGSTVVVFFSWVQPMSKANLLEMGLKLWAQTAKTAYDQLPKA